MSEVHGESHGSMRLNCPTCGSAFCLEASAARHLPFCSERCQSIDLGRWLRESYAFPTTRLDDLEDFEEYEERSGASRASQAGMQDDV